MKRTTQAAFTLVELLTVIFIIALLSGILIPAISGARTQAKKAATSVLFSNIEKGCEAFNTEFGAYPQSRGLNPFEQGNNVMLNGAQWLTLQLIGLDGRGYVKPELRNDKPVNANTGGDGKIDFNDWRDWYEPAWRTGQPPVRSYPRSGPFMTADSKQYVSPVDYAKVNSEAKRASDGNNGGMSLGNNERVPFFVDAFGFPVLYYAANAQVRNVNADNTVTEQPYTTGRQGGVKVGTYDQADNYSFTGSDALNGEFVPNGGSVGMDLGAGVDSATSRLHRLYELGWPPENRALAANEQPINRVKDRTFARFTLDAASMRPKNRDRFILISPGPDRRYGTNDDIRNFQPN